MKKVRYSDFKLNLKYWLDKVRLDKTGVVIQSKRGKDVALVSLEEYNSLKETIYLLSGKNRDVLLNSIKELEEGEVVSPCLNLK